MLWWTSIDNTAYQLSDPACLAHFLLRGLTDLPEVPTDEIPSNLADVYCPGHLVAALHTTRRVDRVPEQAEPRHTRADDTADTRPAVNANTHLDGLTRPRKSEVLRGIEHRDCKCEGPVGVKRVNLRRMCSNTLKAQSLVHHNLTVIGPQMR